MEQKNVNVEVAKIMNNHKGRKNAIGFIDITLEITLKGTTKEQIHEAIRQLRKHRKPISSRPNVGYYLDMQEMHGCKSWIKNWRNSMRILPETPVSLSWV